MTCSVPFRPHLSECGTIQPSVGFHANPVTVPEDEPSNWRSHVAQSLRLSEHLQQSERFQSVAPAQTAGRRVGADAGATSVFAAVNRHDTPSLALARSW